MRGLFRWAAKAKLAKDPTIGVEDPARPKTQGFVPWTEDDVTAYETRWPIGTRQRVWLDVLVYTGLRRGDAVKLGRQHVRNGIATLKTEKTGTEAMPPILPVLSETLAAGPCGDLTFIMNARGQAFTKESFGNAFAEAARIAAIRCAQNGATVPQMNAIFGWTGSRMALHYIEAADRRRLATEAMGKLNKERTDCPAPLGEVRGGERKA